MALSSEEGDLELRDAVLQLLEDSGALSKIKAELRSRVFQALYDSNQLRGKLPPSRALQFSGHEEGRLALSLVKDLLQCLDLNFTMSVFEAEVQAKTLLNRKETAAKLDIGTSLEEPLLSSVVNSALNPRKTETTTNRQNVDVQTMFAEQSFFAQLDNEGGDKEESSKSEQLEAEEEPRKKTVFSPPRSPEKSRPESQKAVEMHSTTTSHNNKLSPLKPLPSLKDLPQLQPPSKLPSLKRPPPEPVKLLDADSGDDVESLGDDLLSSLGDSSTNEVSTSQAEIPNGDYVENVA
ncbi:FGFR1 oncogene partner [Galendromus occidentalis]|uniref:FGFR1 oncogene partner n=1 Tax=Galendromus occidentalis TaxID=34638 RepID=A0AAJ6VZR3_9ACAR|nr:FGFR1 oncogene partner [Galendromus occidentalis]